MADIKNSKPGRAGVYLPQPTGYKAFIPKPLPPVPLLLSDEINHLLSEANIALGRLDGSIQTLPEPDLFMCMYVRKEAVLSSQIEGTQASLNDVIKAETDLFDPEKNSDTGEVINYIAAMNYGLGRLTEIPLSLRLIKEIHEQLMRGVRGSKM
jgi:Fic family protein